MRGGGEGDPGHVWAGGRPGEGEVLPGGGGHVVPHHWLGGGVGSVALWPLGGGDVVQQVLLAGGETEMPFLYMLWHIIFLHFTITIRTIASESPSSVIGFICLLYC